MHHGDAVGERQRLDLVVGHIDHGRSEPIMQLLQFDPELCPELGVEVRQRLVEEENVDVADQRPPDRDALALAARKLRRAAAKQRLDLQELRRPLDPAGDLVLRHPRHAEAEGEVPLRRHPRIERVGLEDHADAAVLRLLPGDVLAVDPDLAAGDVEQAGDGVEQRRLPAARRPEQDDEFARRDVEIEIPQDLEMAERDAEILDRDFRHLPTP